MENKTPRILIVDDDANLLMIMSDIFKMNGFEPVTEQAGRKALAQIEEHNFDIALIDLRLEDISGLKVLSEIKARSPETECILLTGYASQNSAIEAIQMGVYGFFQKPFDMEQLLLSIRRALEKKTTAKALQESERFARATVDALSSHIAILDETGAILAVNRAWREFARHNSDGMPDSKLCEGANYLSVCDSAAGENSDEAAGMAVGIRAVMSGKQREFLLEYPCHSSEERRWFSARVTRFPGEGPLKIVVAHENITERKRAERELYDSEERFKKAFQYSAIGMALVSLEGQWLKVNSQLCSIIGYSEDELLTKTFQDVTHPDDLGDDLNLVNQLLAGEIKTYMMEKRYLHKGGKIVWVLLAVALARNNAGAPLYFISQIEDITARKQAEEAQRQSELQFRALFELSPDAVMLIDPHDPNVSWPIVDCNTAACLMNGYNRDELIGHSINIVNTDSATQDVRNAYLKQVQEAGNLKLESFHRHKNGAVFPIEVSTALIKVGNRELIIGIDRDITERKRTEESLVASEARLRALVEQVPAIVYTEAAKNRETLYISPQVEKITGYTPAEWVEDRGLWKRLVHPKDLKVLLAEDERTNINLEPFHCDYRILARDGRTLWIHDEAVIIKNQDGMPLFWQGVMYDITESRQAEEALKESEERYRSIFDGVQDAIFIESKDSRILGVNRRACEMYGYNRDEFLKKTVRDLVPEERDILYPTDKQPNISSTPIETVNRRANGDLFPVEISGGLQTINGEEVFLVILRDTTERKRAEDELRQSEQRFQQLANNIEEVFWITDAESGKEIYISPAAEKVWGMPVENLYQGQYLFLENILPEDRQIALDAIERQLQGAKTEMEYRIQHPDGSVRWIWDRAFPVLDETGRVLHVTGLTADITERKLAEMNIRQHVKELELLYESGLAFSHLLNPKEIAQKIIELLGEKLNWHHTAIRLVHPEDGTFVLLAFDQPGMESNKAETHLRKFVTRVDEGLSGWALQQSKIVRSGDVNNDSHYVASYPGMRSGLYVPLKSGNHALGVISIESEQPDAFSDADEQLLVTLANQAANAFENARLYKEVRQYSEELEQRVQERTTDLSRVNADLAQAMRVKDEFLASMSHELRTPLTGILGLSEALQLKVYGELNETQSKTLKTIEESGRHLLDLINDILDLSKIEAGKLELQFAPCSLADICQASLQLVKGMAQKKNQRVHYTSPAEPIIIRADARRLKQLLVNLLSNAIKFTPQNSELGLEVKTNASERKFELTVWDKGIGIDPNNLQNIFKPFVQLDSGLAREYSGTGLGLSLVKRLTELHNGEIEVETGMGEGSRFTIVLPWSPENATPIPYLPRRGTGGLVFPPEPSKTPLVMFADDNEMVLQMVADFLETRQYRVMKVHSGTELIEQASKFHPDIMLVDIQMPGMGGLETIRRIRSHPDPLVAAVPIIAVTALAMPTDRERCLDAGANDYMSKPLRLKALVVAIQKLLERKP